MARRFLVYCLERFARLIIKLNAPSKSEFIAMAQLYMSRSQYDRAAWCMGQAYKSKVISNG